jgi:hypothetical protein
MMKHGRAQIQGVQVAHAPLICKKIFEIVKIGKNLWNWPLILCEYDVYSMLALALPKPN